MFFLGLANRGLGSLEMAQDEKLDEPVRTQALADGNQFYAECNIELFLFLYNLLFFSNRTCTRKRC